jgi:TetR/AcrR family transcriptional regulator, cholesterol catabolism regulator
VSAPNGKLVRKGRISEDRWRAILDAAAGIFARKGYEGTTIRDIAEAVGMLAGSLYYYIESKEDLLFAVVDEIHRDGRRLMEEPPIPQDDPVEAIRETVLRHVRFTAENVVRTAVFYDDFRYLAPERKAAIVESRRSTEREIATLIERGQRDGLFETTVEPELASIAMLGFLNSIHQWYRPGGRWTPEQLAQAYAELVLGGLLSPANARRPASRPRRARAKQSS